MKCTVSSVPIARLRRFAHICAHSSALSLISSLSGVSVHFLTTSSLFLVASSDFCDSDLEYLVCVRPYLPTADPGISSKGFSHVPVFSREVSAVLHWHTVSCSHHVSSFFPFLVTSFLDKF